MSTFKGPIEELPYVSADNFIMDCGYDPRFNKDSSCFFLSHCHTDHMKGLFQDPFLAHITENANVYLYCSSISKAILSTYSVLEPIMHKIKELSVGINTIHVSPCNQNGAPYTVAVSSIPAGHCPGSLMFLFETSQHTVLYTGDFRVGVGDVEKFRQLHDGETVKSIDKIYFDATFFSPLYYAFPSRKESIGYVIKLTREWLDANPENHVRLDMPANYGGETIIKEVARELKCRVHVATARCNLFQRVPEISIAFTSDCQSTRIHAKGWTTRDKCARNYWTENLLIIKPNAGSFQCSQGSKPVWSKLNEKRKTTGVNYSSHSSYSEILNFLQYLRPKKIFASSGTYNCDNEYLLKERDELIEKVLSSWTDKYSCSPEAKRSKPNEPADYKPIRIVIPPSSACKIITDEDLDSPPLASPKDLDSQFGDSTP